MIATSHSRISEYREENKNEGFPALNPKRNGLWSSLPSPLSHPSYRLYPYTLLRDNEQLRVGFHQNNMGAYASAPPYYFVELFYRGVERSPKLLYSP